MIQTTVGYNDSKQRFKDLKFRGGIYMKNNRVNVWTGLSVVSFVISAILIFVGFEKMFVYENGESYPYDLHNAYVGGDAYNYIINGNYATAFFVLATLFALLGVGFIIVHYLHKADSTQELLTEQNLLKEKLEEQSSLVEHFIQREQAELDQTAPNEDTPSSNSETIQE